MRTISTLVFVSQLEVYYKVDSFLSDLTAKWDSNKTTLIQTKEDSNNHSPILTIYLETKMLTSGFNRLVMGDIMKNYDNEPCI